MVNADALLPLRIVFLILLVNLIEEGLLVSRLPLLFAISRLKKLHWALISLRLTTVLGKDHRITTVVSEGVTDVILCLAPRLLFANISFPILCHGTNHACAFRIGKVEVIGRRVCPRWLVRHLHLPTLIIEVEDGRFLMRLSWAVVLCIHRLDLRVVLVLKQFVLMPDAVLARYASRGLALLKIPI